MVGWNANNHLIKCVYLLLLLYREGIGKARTIIKKKYDRGVDVTPTIYFCIRPMVFNI